MSKDPRKKIASDEGQMLEDLRDAVADDTSRAGDDPLTPPDSISPGVPKRVGRYHIRRLIATGGMGSVYEAIQENPRRTVAVKLMKAGLTSRSALRRFEFESQLLGRLRHPGIAQVYEAGTHKSDAGPVPYFAMEYIPNGKSLTAYAKGADLNVRERLRLFAEICDAVHHGHQKGIVHRDLKPGNILVDTSGRPKIIDFGVARATDSDLAVTTLQTNVGQLVGTIQYMSPEQCATDPHDIDTRSDVYTLGVVLYELLSGELPYQISRTDVLESIRVVREKIPKRLSETKIVVRGEIETIVLKALEKERSRRYQSAIELAQDIRRYLAGEAIIARSPSLAYHLRVFARRNRAFFSASVVVLVILVVSTAVSTSLYFDARATRNQAVKSELASRQVSDFLVGLFQAANPWKRSSETVTVRELLDQGVERIATELADAPEVRATLQSTFGHVYKDLGSYDVARPLLEAALAQQRELLGPEHPAVAETLHSLGALHYETGDFPAAEESFREALDIRRIAFGAHPIVAGTLSYVGATLLELGRRNEALSLLREALAMHRAFDPASDKIPLTLTHLGSALTDMNQFDEAERVLREALAGARSVHEHDHPDVSNASYLLAYVLIQRRAYDEAKQLLLDGLESRRRLFGPRHSAVGTVLFELGRLEATMGNLPESRRQFEAALKIYRDAHGPENRLVVMTLETLGATLAERGEFADAEAPLREAFSIQRKIAGPTNPNTLGVLSMLVNALLGQGKIEEAEPLALTCWREYLGTFGAHQAKTKEAVAQLVRLYKAKGEVAEAQRFRAMLSAVPASVPSEFDREHTLTAEEP